MSRHPSRLLRRPLAAALLVAIVAPGAAFAQTAREKALEARVAELERQVQMLVSLQQGPDHPVHPAIAETDYLKGFVCRVLPA